MVIFCDNSELFSTVNYFQKSSILDVWMGSEYTSATLVTTNLFFFLFAGAFPSKTQ